VSSLLIPAATRTSRVITPEIRTQVLARSQGGGVVATYKSVQAYPNPNAAPVFARMWYERPQRGADALPTWKGEVVLQAFAPNEGEALTELLRAVEMTGVMSATATTLLHVWAHDLKHTTLSTPWDQQPLPRTGLKPRRKRLKWRDATGRRLNIYADTLQRYAHQPPRTADDAQEK
jgi:hypothetical protein